ncbi:MAG: hypothetical protein KAI02_05255 [Gammaproteobacteria bacterium]|nr:hypothetical protein [Gammaproteobacteria bacterium]
MNTKKLIIYAIVALVAIIILKIIIVVSWKLILFSLMILVGWLVFDNIIKPRMKNNKSFMNIKK